MAASAPRAKEATAAPATRALRDLPWGLATRGSSAAGMVAGREPEQIKLKRGKASIESKLGLVRLAHHQPQRMPRRGTPPPHHSY